MRFTIGLFVALFISSMVSLTAIAQQTVVTGVVTDASSSDPMPYAQVYIPNTGIGTVTDFNGRYTLKFDVKADSIIASYVGFEKRAKPVVLGKSQTINFQLNEAVFADIVIKGKKDYENPAWEILRGIMDNKKSHDINKLDSYQYESYVRLEGSIDNITEKFRNRKAVQDIIHIIDTITSLNGEDGKPIIPVFLSESISDYYHIKNPKRRKEIIKKTKVDGVGITDGSTISQIVGSTFQPYNFYNNIMTIANKDLVSPLSESWKFFYDYTLENTPIEPIMADGHPVWKISFKPKRTEDLAFTGTMWVTDSTYGYALKRIELTVGKGVNINFIEKLKIQQELVRIDSSDVWMPYRSRILVDVGELNDKWAGMLLKNYVSNRAFVINQPPPLKFFDQDVIIREDAMMDNGENYWQSARHDSLTVEEIQKYRAIEKIKEVPAVKTMVDITEFLINGYQPIGKKLELGTYTYLYANNTIEGHRFRLGLRTTPDFSKKIEFKGYMAYGTEDELFKYDGTLRYIMNRKNWTELGVGTSYDLERVGIFDPDQASSALFNASVRWGRQRAPFYNTMYKFWMGTQLTRNIRQTITLRKRHFSPHSSFAFEYYDPERVADQILKRTYQVSEAVFETRIAYQEKFIQNGNNRISLGTRGRPVFTIRYTYGFDGALESDFSFHKLYASVEQYVRIGGIGRFNYRLSGGWIPSQVPFPLLETHLGNESVFYNSNSFNLMNYFEFVSDRYATVRAIHRFNGFLFNRVPLVRKLKWRSLVTANVLYGTISQENLDLIPEMDTQGRDIERPEGLGEWPYVEVGYGIENIFRFVRVEAIHRLTYLDSPGAERFAVKVSAQFRL